MNKQEKQYAMNRIDEIVCHKVSAIKDKHTTAAVSLTDTQRLQAFKAGKYKIKADVSKITRYTDLCDVIEFPDEKAGKANREKIDSESAKVTSEAVKIKDKLMLGDASEALAMIEAFSK